MRRGLACLLVLLPALAGCGRLIPAHHQTVERSALRAGAYRLDPEHSTILWKVAHLGYSTFVGRFDRYDATLDFDPEQPEDSVLEVSVETGSIDSHVPGFADTLRGAAWLDAETYPEARFVSREIRVTGEATGEVVGDFTLMGVTRPVTLDVVFNGGATNFVTGRYTLGFAASAVLDRTAFGLTALAPAIGGEVTLEIHAEFLAGG